jgi:hypothetical protein
MCALARRLWLDVRVAKCPSASDFGLELSLGKVSVRVRAPYRGGTLGHSPDRMLRYFRCFVRSPPLSAQACADIDPWKEWPIC